MDNNVIEVFIKARRNRRLPLYYLLILLAAAVLSALVYYHYRLIGVFLVIIICAIAFYGIILVKKYNDLEYEISIVSGEMTVSEIRSQTKRKKVANFLIKDIENFRVLKKSDMAAVTAGPDPSAKDGARSVRKLYCFGDGSGDGDADIYSFTGMDTADGRPYQVYMEVEDERIVDELVSKSFEARRVLKRF